MKGPKVRVKVAISWKNIQLQIFMTYFAFDNSLLNMIPKSKGTKEKIN